MQGRSGLTPRGSSPDPNPQPSGSPGVNLPPLAGCLAPGTKTSLAGRVPGAYGPRRHTGRAGHSRLRGQRFLQLGTRPSAHLFPEPEGFSLGLPFPPFRKRCPSNLPPHLLPQAPGSAAATAPNANSCRGDPHPFPLNGQVYLCCLHRLPRLDLSYHSSSRLSSPHSLESHLFFPNLQLVRALLLEPSLAAPGMPVPDGP